MVVPLLYVSTYMITLLYEQTTNLDTRIILQYDKL